MEVDQKVTGLVDRFIRRSGFFVDQAGGFYRWVLAACLSSNGGAIVAAFTFESVDHNSRFWAICWFLGGAAIAVFAGIWLANAMKEMADELENLAGSLQEFARSKDLTVIRGESRDRLKSSGESADFAFKLSYAALVCFIVGVVILAFGIR